jgi:prepilin-type N-terminal cleavage/methylation domain-containing protein
LRYLRRSYGFSLIEVMIVVGVSAVVMMAMLSLNVVSLKSNKTIATNSEVGDILNNLRMSLSEESICNDTLLRYFNPKKFPAANPTSMGVSRIDHPSSGNKPFLEAGKSVPNLNNVTIESIAIVDIRDVSPPSAPNTAYMGELTFNLLKNNVFGDANSSPALPIYLKTTRNASDAVVNGCALSSVNLSVEDMTAIKRDVCLSMTGTTWDGVNCKLPEPPKSGPAPASTPKVESGSPCGSGGVTFGSQCCTTVRKSRNDGSDGKETYYTVECGRL